MEDFIDLAAEALAPYRHARLTPTDTQPNRPMGIIRVPRQAKSLEEWQKQYARPELISEEVKRAKELTKQLLARVSEGKPN